jgi:hypothetical protein
VNELRQNLDQSLLNVSTASCNVDEASSRLLHVESHNLNRAVNKFGADYTARLTPSKLRPETSASMRAASSLDNLSRSPAGLTASSTPVTRTKRVLGFQENGRH